MRKSPVVLIALIIFSFGACTKRELNKQEDLNSLTSVSNTKIFVEKDYSGIYIDNTEDIIISDLEIGDLRTSI